MQKSPQSNAETVTIKGQIERITHYNEENFYAVVKFKQLGTEAQVWNKNQVLTAVGVMPMVSVGEEVEFVGVWEKSKYVNQWDRSNTEQKQLKVAHYQSLIPSTLKGIERYLGSGLIKGIGPKTAKKIVRQFGEKTIDIIEKTPERLMSIEGFGKSKVKMIQKAWEEQKEIKNIMIFLQGKGISPTYSVKIYKTYGDRAISIINQNPYQIAYDIHGIGFLTVDKMASNMGIPKDSIFRIEAAIMYILEDMGEVGGHTYVPYEQLIQKCVKDLGVTRELVVKAFGNIAKEEKIFVVDDINNPDQIDANNKAVFLAKYFYAEKGIAESLHYMKTFNKRHHIYQSEQKIVGLQKKFSIPSLAKEQLEAINTAVSEKLMILTGGPGTGKSTITKFIVNLYQTNPKIKITLAAPTGKAAKRMTEITGFKAQTIHRLLEASLAGFKRNFNNPIDADVIILDEMSMVDTLLMNQLLKAIPRYATVIFIGDINQLPSVGAGNVLKDLIQSEEIKTIKLNHVFRQGAGSLIKINAQRINEGEMPIFDETNKDFQFKSLTNSTDIVNEVIKICQSAKGDPINDIQVLVPMYKGEAGANNINKRLQELYTDKYKTTEIKRFDRVFREQDKVMQIANDYDKDVYNGDTGKIVKIDKDNQELYVDFDGELKKYDFSDLDELVLAYATTIHKSQGSEFKKVIMPLTMEHSIMLQRELLYTGVTRGKNEVVILGDKKALAIAVNNNKQQKRNTMLREILKEDRIKLPQRNNSF